MNSVICLSAFWDKDLFILFSSFLCFNSVPDIFHLSFFVRRQSCRHAYCTPFYWRCTVHTLCGSMFSNGKDLVYWFVLLGPALISFFLYCCSFYRNVCMFPCITYRNWFRRSLPLSHLSKQHLKGLQFNKDYWIVNMTTFGLFVMLEVIQMPLAIHHRM